MTERVNRSVVRNTPYQKNGIGIRERHNERKNGQYANSDIIADRLDQNAWYKRCAGTYEQELDRMLAAGAVSTRGHKPDSKVFGELVFDVNTYYFEMNGGYDYAKTFFEEVFRFAEKEIGSDYILSAVMHADELHRGYLEEYGREMYHYHLHVIYVPVVQKEIKWSKRCKDKSLVGTTKEIINQISASKKWAFTPAVDENGNPVYDRNGKRVYTPSYSLLQDRFFEHMRAAGYEDLERGVRGSTAEHLTVIEYKAEKAGERLAGMEDKIAEEEIRLEKILSDRQDVEQVEAYADEVGRMGRYNDTRHIELTENQHLTLTTLAREGLYSRKKINTLEEKISDLEDKLKTVVGKFTELYEKTRDFAIALRLAPERIKEAIGKVFAENKEKAELLRAAPMPKLFNPTVSKEYERERNR